MDVQLDLGLVLTGYRDKLADANFELIKLGAQCKQYEDTIVELREQLAESEAKVVERMEGEEAETA